MCSQSATLTSDDSYELTQHQGPNSMQRLYFPNFPRHIYEIIGGLYQVEISFPLLYVSPLSPVSYAFTLPVYTYMV